MSSGAVGGMMAVQVDLLATVLQQSQAQTQALTQSMIAVNAQSQVSAEQMAVAAEIINAYGGSIDITV